MLSENVAELVRVKKAELDRKAGVLVNINQIAKVVLESGKDPIVGLALRRQVFWGGQKLAEQQRKLYSFPRRHQALLVECGLDTLLELPKPVVVPRDGVENVKVEKKKFEKLPRIFVQVTVDRLNFSTGSRKAQLINELLARGAREPVSGVPTEQLAMAVYPELQDDPARAKAYLSVLIGEVQKDPNLVGVEVVSTRKIGVTKPGDPAKYFLPKITTPMPTPAGDGARPLGGNEDEITHGDLTFSEEEILILGYALYVAYTNFQKNGKMESFGIVITQNTADVLKGEITGANRVNLSDPRFNLDEIFPDIVRKMTYEAEQAIQQQNNERVAVLLRIFANLRRTEGVATLRRKLEDILGNYRRLLEKSAQEVTAVPPRRK